MPTASANSARDVFLRTITVLVCLAAILVTRADPDLWGHIKFGVDAVRGHALTSTDPYSFTSDRPWINHEWLSEVIFGSAFMLGGSAALVLLKAALILTTVVLIVRLTIKTNAIDRQSVVLGVLTLAGVLPRSAQIRPQLFSVLCFAMLLYLLRAAEDGRRRALWFVPLVMVTWANSHGGWPIGCLTVILWSVGRVWESRQRSARWTVAFVALPIAAILATLANPYGPGLWRFLIGTVGPSRQYIAEWGPITSVPAFMVLWLLVWLAFICAVWQKGMPSNRAHVLIPLVLGVASAKISRIDTFFALSVLAFYGDFVIDVFNKRRNSQVSERPLSRPVVPQGFAPLLVIPFIALLSLPTRLLCIDVHGPWMPEPDAIQFIQSRHLQGRLVTFFDWGEYALWYLPPGLRISIDGRRETVYSQAVVDGHMELYRGTDAGIVFLQHLNADYVWLPKESPALQRLMNSGWTSVFAGDASRILARHWDAETGEPLPYTSSAPRSCRCFPGP